MRCLTHVAAKLIGEVAICTAFDPPIPCEVFVGIGQVLAEWNPELTAEQAAPAILALWRALQEADR